MKKDELRLDIYAQFDRIENIVTSCLDADNDAQMWDVIDDIQHSINDIKDMYTEYVELKEEE